MRRESRIYVVKFLVINSSEQKIFYFVFDDISLGNLFIFIKLSNLTFFFKFFGLTLFLNLFRDRFLENDVYLRKKIRT